MSTIKSIPLLKQLLQSFYSKYQKKSFRLALGVCWLFLSLVGAYQLKNLEVDFNFESFFEEESADRVFFNQHKQVFGYDNDY
ncbi:MAG: putative RND superfamily exporter protein, partial [Marivirga sp.]